MEDMRNAAVVVGPQDTAESRPLPTALWGFRKKDVLAAIDEMMQANRTRQQELSTQIETLEQQLEESRQDSSRMEERSRALSDQLSTQQETARKLEQQVADAKRESESFRAKLFVSEKDNYTLRQEQASLKEQTQQLQKQLEQAQELESCLRKEREAAEERTRELETLHSEKENLSTRINELEQSLNGWRAREEEIEQQVQQARKEAVRVVQEAKQDAEKVTAQARRDADKILIDANRAAVHLQEDAQEEILRRQQAAQASAESLGNSIHDLQQRLAAVEKQMDDAYSALKDAAERIRTAAEQTVEKGKEVGKIASRYGIAEEKPEDREKTKPHPPAPPKPGGEPEQLKKSHGLSDLVLEKLTRLLS